MCEGRGGEWYGPARPAGGRPGPAGPRHDARAGGGAARAGGGGARDLVPRVGVPAVRGPRARERDRRHPQGLERRLDRLDPRRRRGDLVGLLLRGACAAGGQARRPALRAFPDAARRELRRGDHHAEPAPACRDRGAGDDPRGRDPPADRADRRRRQPHRQLPQRLAALAPAEPRQLRSPDRDPEPRRLSVPGHLRTAGRGAGQPPRGRAANGVSARIRARDGPAGARTGHRPL